jgi:putative ABC transport system ATP-binding protein
VSSPASGDLSSSPSTVERGIMVDVRDVTRTYGSGPTATAALRGVTFSIGEGRLVALRGRSGSGKTTLLNVVGGLDSPSGGTVHVAGQDVTAMGERGRMRLRRETVAYIFQSFGLLPVLSASENVGVPLRIAGVAPREREERVALMLSIVGLADHAKQRPGGPSPAGRSCCWRTSRPASSTRRPASRSCGCCARSSAPRGSPRWSRPTTRS